jgi:hypothetical protein
VKRTKSREALKNTQPNISPKIAITAYAMGDAK